MNVTFLAADRSMTSLTRTSRRTAHSHHVVRPKVRVSGRPTAQRIVRYVLSATQMTLATLLQPTTYCR